MRSASTRTFPLLAAAFWMLPATLDCSASSADGDAGLPPVTPDGGSSSSGSSSGSEEAGWVNDEMARAIVRAVDQIQCDIRCSDPSSGGEVGSIDCEGGGTASWRVDLDILAGRADSTFSYEDCSYVTEEGDELTLDGELYQLSSLTGDGEERGTIEVSGNFSGSYTSSHVFHSRERDGGFVTVTCTEHAREDLTMASCAPDNLATQHPFPDYKCEGAACR